MKNVKRLIKHETEYPGLNRLPGVHAMVIYLDRWAAKNRSRETDRVVESIIQKLQSFPPVERFIAMKLINNYISRDNLL